MGLATLGPYRLLVNWDERVCALQSDSHLDSPDYRGYVRPRSASPAECYAAELPWFAGMVLLERLFPLDPTRFRPLTDRVRRSVVRRTPDTPRTAPFPTPERVVMDEIRAALFDLRTALYAVPGAWQAINPAYQTAEGRIIRALRSLDPTPSTTERPDGR